jgi:Kdo2-lipid IVA lauroyltransferase/acyltransferase
MNLTLRKVRQACEHAGVRTALAMTGAIPLGPATAIGAGIGRLAYDVARVRRDVSIDNIRRSLGVSTPEASRIARASYANMGRSLMEFAAFRHLNDDDLRAIVEVEGVEHLEAARAAGKGAVTLTGHYGNWELGGIFPRVLGFPVDFLVGQQSNSRVDDVMNNLRRRQRVAIISRRLALRGVVQSLAAGRFVALLADQDARRGGVIVEFLGRPASTVRGPAVFAIRKGSPVIPFFIHRERGPGRRRHRLVFEPRLYARTDLDEDEAIRDLTQRYTDRLAERIREHPTEYFWPHRRWKSTTPK